MKTDIQLECNKSFYHINPKEYTFVLFLSKFLNDLYQQISSDYKLYVNIVIKIIENNILK